MQTRKAKFQGKKTKWEIKRDKRPAKRAKEGKKPLVEPLEIVSTVERNAAATAGKMIFKDGKKKIELPLILNHSDFGKGSLQGVYKRANGNFVTLRAFPENRGERRPAFIGFFSRERDGSERIIRINWGDPAFAYRQPDLAHLQVKESMLREGLGLKAGSKAEREQRAIAGDKGKRMHRFYSGLKFIEFFEKLHYWAQGTLMTKYGNFNPRDDLSKWHRIVAIDPKNGKARMFSFEIGGKKKRK